MTHSQKQKAARSSNVDVEKQTEEPEEKQLTDIIAILNTTSVVEGKKENKK